MKLLLRWLAIALALFVAAYFVPGIRVRGDAWTVFAAAAAILGAVNLLIRPLFKLLSFPLLLLTFGLFSLVINALMLWLASAIAVNFFRVGFYVDGFVPAFLGALVVSLVSSILSALLDRRD